MAKDKPKAIEGSGRGGARPGSGQKPSEFKALVQQNIDAMHRVIAPKFDEVWETLLRLANGGYLQSEERWELAATITVPTLVRDKDGNPMVSYGKPVIVDLPLYPNAPPDQMVRVTQRLTQADGDRAAGIYLMDRYQGRPRQSVDLSVDDKTVPRELDIAVVQAYGENPGGIDLDGVDDGDDDPTGEPNDA